jgi:hypothetical protein
MSYCPNCATELASGASECPKCDAVFLPGAAWAPVEEAPQIAPQEPQSAPDVVVAVFGRLLALCGAALVVAAMTFVAMFSAFSGRGGGIVYAAWALVACGLIWVVHPIYAYATRDRKGKMRT